MTLAHQPIPDRISQPNVGQEQIEGLGEVQGEFWRDYPIDDLLIRHESRTVHEVLRRISRGRFIMNPDFQRDFVWDDSKQSKLIESIIMRIPLPVLYLAEDEEGRMIVVDGLQRLSTFKRFVNNELKLKLPDRPSLHGKRSEISRRNSRTALRIVILFSTLSTRRFQSRQGSIFLTVSTAVCR